MLWALSHLRLEHPSWSYAEVLRAGAVLVWWALGYRKAACVFGLVMLARFRLSLVFKAHETPVGPATGPPPKLNGKDATRAVRLLSRWALQHAEVVRIEAVRSVKPRIPTRRREQRLQPEGQLRLYLELNGHRVDALARAAAIRYLTAPIGRELRAFASRPSSSATERSARGE